ncbi:MAG: transposase [Planctomycetota bacterium]
MTVARREIVFDSVEGVYHCVNRCVRRAFLCGDDRYTAQIFTIEVCGYVVMSNHIHLVIRNRPDLRARLSDREVAERWRRLYPKQFNLNASNEIKEGALLVLLADGSRVGVLRDRLGSISWFMKSLSEPIARRANAEDGCRGRFWEGRFKCQALLDEAAVLACMTYVDLNPIRAKIAKTPEESDFTSVHDHIEARQAELHIKEFERKRRRRRRRKQTPLPLTARQRTYLTSERERAHTDDWLCPLEDSSITRSKGVHGLLGMSLDEYLGLLDWTGRCIHRGKRGTIPSDLKPILDRLKIDCDHWVETVLSFGHVFHRAVGHLCQMAEAAHRAGKRWFQGLHASATCFPDFKLTG